MKRCPVCERELPLSAFRGKVHACRACAAGRRRVDRLVANRPHLRDLIDPVREFLLAWETARLALTRSLAPWGIEVTWRGFVPGVLVRPGSRADPVPRRDFPSA